MAIVEGPALSLRASGNLGTICYASWRGVMIARDIWTGEQPNVGRQAVVQNIFEEVVKAWSLACTAEDRAAWAEFASKLTVTNRLGMQYRPTGYQTFVRMNVFRRQELPDIDRTPPREVKAVHPGLVDISYGALGGEAYVNMTDWAGGVVPDMAQIYKAGPFLRGGYHARTCDYRWIVSAPAPFFHLFTGLGPGKFYWFRVRWFLNAGVVGVWHEGQVLIPF